MYIKCTCNAVFYRYRSRGIERMKHFNREGHKIAGTYTFIESIPEPYFLVMDAHRKGSDDYRRVR